MKTILKWLTGNWYKILKVIMVILIGGLIYKAISGRILNNRANALIESMESDYKRVSDRLVKSQNHVTNLTRTVGLLQLGSAELTRELETSDRIKGDLWNENQRLGGFLSESESSTKAITDIHNELGSAIDRAWEIIERYPVGVGEDFGETSDSD